MVLEVNGNEVGGVWPNAEQHRSDDMGPIRYHGIQDLRSIRGVRCFAGVERHNASRTPEDVADVPVPDDDEEDLQEVVLEVGDTAVDLDDTVKLLLVDSGSYLHVCPPTFMPNVPMRPSDRKIAITAGGQRLEHYGKKVVACAT